MALISSSVIFRSNYVLVMFGLLSGSLSSFLCSTTKADLVDEVCSRETIDPKYCVEAIRSQPGSDTGDLPTLGQIVINLAISKIEPHKDLIKSLKEQTTDPELHLRYDTCLEDCDDANKSLEECTRLLKMKDYLDLYDESILALDSPNGCDTLFDQPRPEPDQLKQANKHLEVLCHAIGIIALKLDGKI